MTTPRAKSAALLCSNCNLTLGKINDSVETLVRMIQYLKGPNYQPADIAAVLEAS